MRIEVLMAWSIKMAVFWFVALCSLVEVYWHSRGACCLHRPDDRGSRHLWNISKPLPDYMAQQLRRQPSSNLKTCSMLMLGIESLLIIQLNQLHEISCSSHFNICFLTIHY
jgi:hypothetical protein